RGLGSLLVDDRPILRLDAARTRLLVRDLLVVALASAHRDQTAPVVLVLEHDVSAMAFARNHDAPRFLEMLAPLRAAGSRDSAASARYAIRAILPGSWTIRRRR